MRPISQYVNSIDKLSSSDNYSTWVGLLNYENSDLKCKYKAIPFYKLTNIRLIKNTNKLIGLEEQKKEYLVGTYKNIEYIITDKIQITTRRVLNSINPNKLKTGIKIQLKGRLRGVSKATSFKKSLGKVRTHTFQNVIEYAEKPLQTKWGKIGLKIFMS